MLLYVAGPYSGDVDTNILNARKVAIALWEKGHAVICPHLNSIHMEQDCKATYDDFLRGDFKIIARCDGLVMTPDWQASKGACAEHVYASSLHMPIWVYPDMPDLHLTEVRSPKQCQGFAEVLGQMYRTHLSKNADYSPANILLTGEVGLITRLWDKTARLLNLLGFELNVDVGTYKQPRQAQHESIEDTYQDSAVYSIIGLLLRRGQWGR